MEKYVIYLSSEMLHNSKYHYANSYGYWSGDIFKSKSYDCVYPGVVAKEDKNIKTYSSIKRAENGLQKCINRFTYVLDGYIEKIISN